ncbi:MULTISPECIES: hypothetical protein [unclassified Acinetobacter]|uniref:hypothetical protein n=1 Tax=unclassified Acinetobacter TaxID=196816 RepID=UPI0015D0D6EA|nr:MULTISPECIES: hypothetical protein [unclassified Acinetobacter]
MVQYAIDLISHAEYAEPATGNRQPATGNRQPATGHLAVYEKPEEFLKLATEFLQKS